MKLYILAAIVATILIATVAMSQSYPAWLPVINGVWAQTNPALIPAPDAPGIVWMSVGGNVLVDNQTRLRRALCDIRATNATAFDATFVSYGLQIDCQLAPN